MKIYIGPYINYFGPYQIAEKLLFWIDKDDDRVDNLGRWLSEKSNGEDTWLTKLCQSLHEKRTRKEKIHIDSYDVWNMDDTLAKIILPMLIKLKGSKHGSPNVDDLDVPEGMLLRRTEAPPIDNEWDTDEFWHKRWDYVISEMIWTFEQLTSDWETQYFDHSEVDKSKGISEQVKTIKYDSEGAQKHSARIDNGLRLFGKYYRALWD